MIAEQIMFSLGMNYHFVSLTLRLNPSYVYGNN
jgi:hypothetical protein